MRKDKFVLLGAICALAFPVVATALPKAGAVFEIESPAIFPDSLLGESKQKIENEISNHLTTRLKFYFPYFDWTVSDDSESLNQLVIRMQELPNATCNVQSDLVVRANTAEIPGVIPKTLYDLCDPFLPNRKHSERDALNDEDQEDFVHKLKVEIDGFLDNATFREAVHQHLLSRIPLAQTFELKSDANGTTLVHLPLNFEDLSADECVINNENCSKLSLVLDPPDSQKAGFNLIVTGRCGGEVQCKVVSGNFHGGDEVTGDELWNGELGTLLSEAPSPSLTMAKFTKVTFPCPQPLSEPF